MKTFMRKSIVDMIKLYKYLIHTIIHFYINRQ